jgi:hypothetical protein
MNAFYKTVAVRHRDRLALSSVAAQGAAPLSDGSDKRAGRSTTPATSSRTRAR